MSVGASSSEVPADISRREPLNPQATPDDELDDSLWNSFTQQRLKAWQINLPPYCAIALYLVGGIAFFVLGCVLLSISHSVEELSWNYTDCTRSKDGVCESELTVTSDMEPPIWVYYELHGFHQNHRRYVKSRSDKQMQAQSPIKDKKHLKECSPAVNGDGGRPLYPCGLVAASVFNDSFAFAMTRAGETGGKKLQVDNSARTIAWPVDVDGGKFKNYDPEAEYSTGVTTQDKLDMWLIRRFPPVECVQTEISESKPYKPVYIRSTLHVRSTGDKVKVANCTGYFTDHPECEFEDIHGNPIKCGSKDSIPRRDQDYKDYQQVRVHDWGLKSGHFMVWMRVAGLPTFRKLWGKIDEKLAAGTRLKVYVASHFAVTGFGGRKALVISTSSSLGGRNDFLGYGYLLVGLCCLIFGAWFLWKHLFP